MANVLILGGGFGGVIAAEQLAKTLAPEHQITLVARSDRFIFYPSLVRLAFGRCGLEDISFDLREAMLSRRVRFIKAEVARVCPYSRQVTLAHGEVTGEIPYDYLIYALGRRLATERVPGFFEHAHHLLTVDAAMRFGEAARNFREGHAVIGSCLDSRLSVPVYETAFALAAKHEAEGVRGRARIQIVSPHALGDELGGGAVGDKLREALDRYQIEFVPNFTVERVTSTEVQGSGDARLAYDLLMLVPPFAGTSAAFGAGITDPEGYIRVDRTCAVRDVERMYAVGDSVNFVGAKMGHMAVLQAETAAANVAAQIEGREPVTEYRHEMQLVIDLKGDSLYLHQELWSNDPRTLKQGRFWSWAKRAHEIYWRAQRA